MTRRKQRQGILTHFTVKDTLSHDKEDTMDDDEKTESGLLTED